MTLLLGGTVVIILANVFLIPEVFRWLVVVETITYWTVFVWPKNWPERGREVNNLLVLYFLIFLISTAFYDYPRMGFVGISLAFAFCCVALRAFELKLTNRRLLTLRGWFYN